MEVRYRKFGGKFRIMRLPSAVYRNVLLTKRAEEIIWDRPWPGVRNTMDERGDSDGSDLAQRGLWRLMLKLPAMRGRLQIMAVKSTILKDLCEAYEEACMAVEQLSKQNLNTGAHRIREYQNLCSEIETDVVHLVLQQSKDVRD